MTGTTGVPPTWSDIFFFLSVFRVIFRVVILRAETFVIVTGIVIIVVLGSTVGTCIYAPKRRMLLWATLVFEGCVYVMEVHNRSLTFTLVNWP